MMNTLELPVEYGGHYNTIVIGAGLAGCAAALAAARNNVKTLLVEALPYIGGNGTIGLPVSSFLSARSDTRIVGGIPYEIMCRLREKGALIRDLYKCHWLPVDCERLQIELTYLLDQAGVDVLTYSPLLHIEKIGRTLKSAVFYNKDTPLQYSTDTFIDASGDAQVARCAQLTTPMGRQRDGKTQSMRAIFSLGGIDLENRLPWKDLQKRWDALRESKNWRNPRSGPALSGPVEIPGKPGVFSFNVTRILVDKGTDNRRLSEAEKEGRYQIEEFVEEFLRKEIRGYERCYLTQIGWHVGVRETRRIAGVYDLTVDDLASQTRFTDRIACNSYPVDIHSPDSGTTVLDEHFLPEGGYYTIPYRSLVAHESDNLLACGRCISATHEALAAVRVLSAAMATGEAVGTAAALCQRTSASCHSLYTELLQSTLRAQGALID